MSIIAPPDQQVNSIRLHSLLDGCTAIRCALQSLPDTEVRVATLAADHLRCIEHEARFTADYPLTMFRDHQCHRLSSYCKEAARALIDLAKPPLPNDQCVRAQELSVAFLSLVPRLLEDYERALNHHIRLHCV